VKIYSINMECSLVFRCECNGKTYPTKQSLNQHKKTKAHQSWENSGELRELKMELTHRDNTILKLKNTIEMLRELNTTLIKRINLEEATT
jgi:hypothetical protein